MMMRFLIGMVTGVVAGMLMAPDKGKRTREKINSEFPKLKKQANDSIQEAFEKTKTIYNDLVNELGIKTERMEKQRSKSRTGGSTASVKTPDTSGVDTTPQARSEDSNM